MVEYETSVFINRLPEDVWNVLADPTSHNKYSNILRLLNPPNGHPTNRLVLAQPTAG